MLRWSSPNSSCHLWNHKSFFLQRKKTWNFQKFALWLVPFVQYNVWPKKVQRIYLSWHWRVMQNLKKTDLWLGKRPDEFVKFSPEQLKVSKLGLWWNLFVQNRKCMSLKFTEQLCAMTLKNNAKFEEELSIASKFTWEIWRTWTRVFKSLKYLHFNKPLLTGVWAKKVQRSYLSWHRRVMQNLMKNWLVVWKMT